MNVTIIGRNVILLGRKDTVPGRNATVLTITVTVSCRNVKSQAGMSQIGMSQS